MTFSKDTIGIIAAVVCFVSMAIYIWAIYVGKVSSNKVTWGVWVFVCAISCASYYQLNGLTATFWVLFVYFVGTVITFTFLCAYAKSGEWTWVEKIALAGCVLALSIWIFFSAMTGMTTILVVDIFGTVPLVVTVYKFPKSEYGLGWCLGFLSNAVNLFAVEAWDYPHAAYPIYLAVMTLSVATFVVCPKFLRFNRT